MTEQEFRNKYVGKAVHCATREKAREFLKLAASFGYVWTTARGLLNHDNWEEYKDETCYRVRLNNEITFSSRTFYISEGYEIVKFESEDNKMKKTKKVFDLGLYVTDRKQKRNNEEIKKVIQDWALECHGLTEEEMSKINKGTVETWMKEVEVKVELTEQEIEVLKALKVLGFEWIARDENNDLYAYELKPIKNTPHYNRSDYARFNSALFEFITRQDEEPTNIEELLKEC